MIKCKLDYVNYNSELHTEFPVLTNYYVYSKDGIINVELESFKVFEEIIDDIGYDNLGKYISISIGQWHNSHTGKYITVEEFYDLDEYEAYLCEYVSAELKIYVKEDYRACYHNNCNRKVTISFIPYDKINFNSRSNGVELLFYGNV